MSTPQENKKDNMRAESTTNKKGDYTHELTKWGLIILVIWLAYMFAHHLVPFFVKDWLPDIFRDNKGQFQIGTFGDYFGALNTLFAGLAFAGLIVTIRQQSADLQATKDEMSRHTEQFKKQNEQERINAIKGDIYNRIILFKQFEKDIELNLIDNGKMRKYSGSKALQELAIRTDDICLTLFPDNQDRTQSIIVTAIAADLRCYAAAFAHIDAWLNNIYILLEDIQAQFLELRDKTDQEHTKLDQLNKEETRCYKIVLNSILQIHLTLLYFFHDTHAHAPIMVNLQKAGLINPHWLSKTSQDSTKRRLFHELILTCQSSCHLEKSIRIIANKWRKIKCWSPLPPLCNVNPDFISDYQYCCPTEKLFSRHEVLSQLQMKYAEASILSSVCSKSESGEAIVLSYSMNLYSDTLTRTDSGYHSYHGNTDTLLWIYSTMQSPSFFYHYAGELQLFYLQE